ncbi:hypothetical protein DYB28_006540 [Aphanomyces astaci]|uniref:Uncharacterized protein n=1 Tax=Aphanomyces astaci TaxID=112090 RepID=A0A397E536_APHAT|nr:hypothetical protein DYB30_009032 [Aphanomyces astaci]RHZ26813.1 hypothetical protein DYB26_006655 [Aphanomyces astaci]RHZ38082.1 hypothetical protein DYB31_007631 [Aphanomyces astaci]RLN99989.1 hypothetical protein DYB28_006540 [Aphanomyces astaci]
MGDGTGQEAATAVKAKPVDDEDEATLEYEEIRVGEIITYYTRLFVAGDPRGKRVSKSTYNPHATCELTWNTVVRIRSDIKNEYPIHVESQDAISKHDMVKRVKDAQGNAVECGLYRKVYTYELIPGKIRGEMASAVLKAAMKNVCETLAKSSIEITFG